MPSTPRKTIARLSPASVASASGRPARRTRSGPPPGYDELEVRSHGKLGSDVEGVGNDREPAVVDELAGDLRGGRPPRQPQGHSLRHQCCGGPGDTALLLLMLGALVPEGELVSDSLGHRAPVGAREQPLLLQDLQVPPDRGRRYVQLDAQVAHVDAATVGEQPQDRREPFRLTHAQQSTRRYS
jgi:hypothetical protein